MRNSPYCGELTLILTDSIYQEQLNDEAIARQCYQQKEAANNDRPSTNGQKQPQFPFRPEHNACSADQEVGDG
jgi:hypothetical protein